MSAGREEFSRQESQTLLEGSRKRNEAKTITGALFYKDGNFLQVIEGEKAIVQQLYVRISNDARHRQIVTLFEEEIPGREFANWSMAFRNMDPQDGDTLEGFNDFFNSPSKTDTADFPAKVRAFLRGFAR